MKSSIKKTISFTLALSACSNFLLASPGVSLSTKEVITAFAKSVSPEEETVSIDKTYLKSGQKLKVSHTEGLTLKYYVSEPLTPDVKTQIEMTEEELTLTDDYYEKFITVEAYNTSAPEPVAVDKVFFSKLPVIYIDTNDGQVPAFKEDKKKGTFHLQNNEETDKALYSGEMTMQGRGNSTWQWDKKPYKIKLDKKQISTDSALAKNGFSSQTTLTKAFSEIQQLLVFQKNSDSQQCRQHGSTLS